MKTQTEFMLPQKPRTDISALSVLERKIGLVDAPSPKELSALVTLLAYTADVPVSLVSIVQRDMDRQFFAAACGLDAALSERRQTPLSHSFCKHVAERGKPLIINNARRNFLVRNNPSVTELNVIAYLGVPIHWVDGTPIGALCTIDTQERAWTKSDLLRLEAFATCVDGCIKTLHALHERRVALAEIELARLSQKVFLAKMNHELRTPLNAVIGMSEALADSCGNADMADYLAIIVDSAVQMEQWLTVAHASVERMTPGTVGKIEQFDMIAEIDEVIAVLTFNSSVQIRVRKPHGALYRRGDRVRLRHVIYDVLGRMITGDTVGVAIISIEDVEDGDVVLSGCAYPKARIVAVDDADPAPDTDQVLGQLLHEVGAVLKYDVRPSGETIATIRFSFPDQGA